MRVTVRPGRNIRNPPTASTTRNGMDSCRSTKVSQPPMAPAIAYTATRLNTNASRMWPGESCATSAGLSAKPNGTTYFTAPSFMAAKHVAMGDALEIPAAANAARPTGGVM